MTIAELITEVLGAIRRQFYVEQPARNYLRDERALTKAIARYGYECAQRGWHFDVKFILHEIMTVLIEIKRSDAEIGYLPVYLDGAMRRHIGQRAEELSAKAKSLPALIDRAIVPLKVNNVRKETPCETLGLLFKELKRKKKVGRPLRARRAPQQPQLL